MSSQSKKDLLQAAKRYYELQNVTKGTRVGLAKVATKFGVPRETLRRFIVTSNSKIGRPPLLTEQEKYIFKLFLLSLDSVGIQMPVDEIKTWMKTLSSSYQKAILNSEEDNINIKFDDRSVSRYYRSFGLSLKKIRQSDPKREDSVNHPEILEQFFLDLEKALEVIGRNPDLIFNVDEVGIQFAERTLRLVTSRISLNKEICVKGLPHVTLTAAFCANGVQMDPHFLFQGTSGEKNFLPGTTHSIFEINETGFQTEESFRKLDEIFFCFQTKVSSRKRI